ncbi:protein Abi2 super family [Candidatus Termititenax aidoneus]|uniref:Protein Abi2 super family n=1 Tax=Termititenax aidoneus TaxID=2218524 RepID=A0A388TEH6_TERA1|nr:protein Abi2 super family [Candidatus Termititenax aidoneus]
MDKLLNQLKQHFSEKRLLSYEKIAQHKNLNITEAVNLYKLNILLCEELYAFISCIEICLRNNIHKKMTVVFGKTNWYLDVDWGDKHKKQLEDAIKKVKKLTHKDNIDPDTLISSISFGFWGHIFDGFYESTLWVKGLNKIFPYYQGSPNRKHIAAAFNTLLKVRNKIAHFESIIKNEKQLLRTYNQMAEVINWISPEIYLWFKSFNNFDSLYKQLTA